MSVIGAAPHSTISRLGPARRHGSHGSHGSPAGRCACACYLNRRHARPDAESGSLAAFSSSRDSRVLGPKEVAKVLAEAEAAYDAPGARAEYCLSVHGVVYDRAVRCLPEVLALERAILLDQQQDASPLDEASPQQAAAEAQGEGEGEADAEGEVAIPALLPKPPRSRALMEVALEVDGRDGTIRVCIAGMPASAIEAFERAGCCPLCRREGHRFALCPHLPNELRPFA